jgi:sugar lactone lactonase YvrE
MHTTAKRGSPATRVRRMAVPLLLLVLLAALAKPAVAAPAAEVIVLPGATSAEGIAAGRGATFYAGDLFAGDIFRGDLQRGTAELFINAPDGRQAVGMAADVAHGLLFVAGGFTGQGYIYDTRSGATVATYQFAAPDTSLINDVALTKDGAWFTDSFHAQLYFVPVSHTGVPGPTFRTLGLSGPAAALIGGGAVNLNGIQATPNGKTLIVAHSANAQLDTVDPTTGASARIAGVSVPNVDGIVLEAGRLGRCRTSATRSPGSGCARTLPPGWWRRSLPATCSRSRPPRRVLVVAWRWSMPSSTPASRPPPGSSR